MYMNLRDNVPNSFLSVIRGVAIATSAHLSKPPSNSASGLIPLAFVPPAYHGYVEHFVCRPL